MEKSGKKSIEIDNDLREALLETQALYDTGLRLNKNRICIKPPKKIKNKKKTSPTKRDIAILINDLITQYNRTNDISVSIKYIYKNYEGNMNFVKQLYDNNIETAKQAINELKERFSQTKQWDESYDQFWNNPSIFNKSE